MAAQDIAVSSISLDKRDTKGSVVIRFKRKRLAPSMESFTVIQNHKAISDTPDSEPLFLSDNVFIRAKTVEVTESADYSQIVREAANESLIPDQIKRLKLNSVTSPINKNFNSPTLFSPITQSDGETVHQGDINNNQINEMSQMHTTDILKMNSDSPTSTITHVSQSSDLHSPMQPVKIYDITYDSNCKLSVSSPCDSSSMPTDTTPITCNGQIMCREDATFPSYQQSEAAHYVYDIYYAEDVDLSMFDDPLGIRVNPLDYDITTITNPPPSSGYKNFMYRYGLDDSDDSNDENNWRNEYPDEHDSTSNDEPDIDRMYRQKYSYVSDDYYVGNDSSVNYLGVDDYDYDPGDEDDFSIY